MSNILNKYDVWARDLHVDNPETFLEMAEFFRHFHLHWIFCTVHENSTCHNNKCIFAASTWQFARRNGLGALAAQVAPQLPTNPAHQRQFSTMWKRIEETENLARVDFPWASSSSCITSMRLWFGITELIAKL